MQALLYICVLIFLGWPLAISAANSIPALDRQLEQGDQLLASDKLPEALSVFAQAIKSYPRSSAAHEHFARALSLSGYLKEAQREAQQAIELDPLNAQAHSNLGWIFGIQKNYHQAIKEEQIAIHLDPSIASSHTTLALALTSIGDYENALQSNKAAIALEPDNLKAYINLAATLGRKGDYAQAIEVYQKALQLNSKSVAAHLGLGAALGKSGLFKEQVQEFRIAVSLAPNSDNAHGKLGWALYKIGDWDGALREGCITNWIRLSKSGPEYLHSFVGLWGGVFLLFGLIFSVIFFGCHFNPSTGELVDKSYFLIFHNEKPGRFIVTNKRFVFIPEAFSQWFGSQPISMDRDQINKLDPHLEGKHGVIEISMNDGSTYTFSMPSLVAKPLLDSIGKLETDTFTDNQ